jgi:beta-phosphoglucomutase
LERSNKQILAAIFDMDGTLIDNTPYHFKAWQQLFKKRGLPELSRETYLSEISGVPIINTIKKYIGDDMDEAEQRAIINEKQRLYRDLFQPVLPLSGLETFLFDLKGTGFRIALATSSNMDDVDFIFDSVPIRQYFDAIITGNMVSQPKPSPQIFLKAAEQLDIRPENCVVFEDSLSGLQAGNNAAMKVIGITTAHPAEKITKLANLVINDYADVTPQKLAKLFDK